MKTTTSITERISLSGKTALVTGASSGLGKECARIFALRGANTLLMCRSYAKAQAAIASFSETIGPLAELCSIIPCDISLMESVYSSLSIIKKYKKQIDILLLNAGIFGVPFQLTGEGLELTHATNYAGHFLLVHELLRMNLLSPSARIITTISEDSYKIPFSAVNLSLLIEPNEPETQKNVSPRQLHINSKVFLLYFLQEFTRRSISTQFSTITANGADPGPTRTENPTPTNTMSGWVGSAWDRLRMKSVEEGAVPLVWLATSPEVAWATGKLFGPNCKEIKLPPRCTQEETANMLWTSTERLLRLRSFPDW